jgi:hypothetical protein
LNLEHANFDSAHLPYPTSNLDETELSDLLFEASDEQTDSGSPKYETTERIFRLLRLLALNSCTRQDIFEHLRDYDAIPSFV